MAEEIDTQKPDSEAVNPASAGSVAFGDMWIAPSGALAFCWTVTRHQQRTQELTAEAVTFADGKWGGLTSCSATWAQRKRIRRTIPDPQGLKLAICQAACAEIDRPIEYAAWKRGTPKGWSSGIPQNDKDQATVLVRPNREPPKVIPAQAAERLAVPLSGREWRGIG